MPTTWCCIPGTWWTASTASSLYRHAAATSALYGFMIVGPPCIRKTGTLVKGASIDKPM